MKLSVLVLEAKDLPLPGTASASGPYVKVRVGNAKSRTRLLWNNPNPKWNKEFVFTTDDPATAGEGSNPVIGQEEDEEGAPVMMMPPMWFAIERPTT
ncbi:hypothetical protein MLD38_003284 [Melastoma candidum]|uniref:Uncharacterized protein n=1 Tax=Melastoma candidum TaxID=119954 RepID=A0ACB9S3F7_9MYRT|nr:hypothetical protein MLD38_003284 [Melastoma candidum]